MQVDQSGLPSTTTRPLPSAWVCSISVVKPKTSRYHGVLRSMSVAVTPTWLMLVMSGMCASGGGKGDTQAVGGGDADQRAEIGVGR
jgi:hypothetical protein